MVFFSYREGILFGKYRVNNVLLYSIDNRYLCRGLNVIMRARFTAESQRVQRTTSFVFKRARTHTRALLRYVRLWPNIPMAKWFCVLPAQGK